MAKPTLLIVDDEQMIHVLLKSMLVNEYNLLFASDAQEAIDILSESAVNLVLLDIQMPELSGLELLQSIMLDTSLNQIPILIVTGKATKEREQRARELGAADFIAKDDILSGKDKAILQELIKKNIRDFNVSPKNHDNDKSSCRSIINGVMKESGKKDFFNTARKLGLLIKKHFQVEYISFWASDGKKPNMLLSLGDNQPEDFGPDEIQSEDAYSILCRTRRPYLTNNPSSEKKGIFANTAMERGLSSEIAIPLYKLRYKTFSKNKFQIPPDCKMYGFIILKRNRLFTTWEYKLLTKTVVVSGTILWELYQNIFAEK